MAELKPAIEKSFWERLLSKLAPESYEKQKESEALGILGIGGDKYARTHPNFPEQREAAVGGRGAIARLISQNLEKNLGKTAAKRAAVKGGQDKFSTLFRGGPEGNFWTKDPQRAASYGDVKSKMGVPEWQFQGGKAKAADLGQPTTSDTYLADAFTKNGTRARPDIQPEINIAEDLGSSEVDNLFASLGIKRF